MLARLDGAGVWFDASRKLSKLKDDRNGQKDDIATKRRLIDHDDKRHC